VDTRRSRRLGKADAGKQVAVAADRLALEPGIEAISSVPVMAP
jgi:hypothetical protein